ncbi:hypothetical protein D5086_010765 [Populus alba]|uniref:Uncharacterized protein n=1 Tax=Populus alba TaxID=43335 RepID=A0ACC4CC19_POPAL
MDVDMVKSSSGEEHMDMMTMMMQMEKLPDFCSEPFYNTTNTSTLLQEIQFSNGNPTANTVASPPIWHDPHASSPPLINPPCSMPFMGTPIQEPMQVQSLEQTGANRLMGGFGITGVTMPSVGYSSLVKNFDPAANMVGTMQMLR